MKRSRYSKYDSIDTIERKAVDRINKKTTTSHATKKQINEDRLILAFVKAIKSINTNL